MIAPVDTLDLLANNGHKLPDYNSLDVSLDGYLVFRKKNVDDLMFTIIVRKNENNKKKFAHFTLIASTAGSTFRLEPSSAHY